MDLDDWRQLPWQFWSACWFMLGCMVGSFLNVCVHRMPLGISVITPPSHCPKCQARIPWYLNLPLVTWVCLRGRCRDCHQPIAVRYLAMELGTGLMFVACWHWFGPISTALAVTYATVLSALLVATLIDFDHFIIPDEITLGGIAAGLIYTLVFPSIHGVEGRFEALSISFTGAVVGWLLVYAIVRLGKLMFGSMKVEFSDCTLLVFTESNLILPEEAVPYEELFYRKTDQITLMAEKLELADRCYAGVRVRLSPGKLLIDGETFDPEKIPHMEAWCRDITLPREAMGLGDVKFMGAIGAFLGWQSTFFSLMVSSMIGAILGVGLILIGRREWSSRLPFGPYIALAAVIWMFMPGDFRTLWNQQLGILASPLENLLSALK
jgi:leader peptidase (prepilin peptidase)/N-methyltransferase